MVQSPKIKLALLAKSGGRFASLRFCFILWSVISLFCNNNVDNSAILVLSETFASSHLSRFPVRQFFPAELENDTDSKLKWRKHLSREMLNKKVATRRDRLFSIVT